MDTGGFTLFAPSYILLILNFLPIILSVILTVFGIYFVIRAVRFMKIKIKLDRERNKKIDELIRDCKRGNQIE